MTSWQPVDKRAHEQIDMGDLETSPPSDPRRVSFNGLSKRRSVLTDDRATVSDGRHYQGPSANPSEAPARAAGPSRLERFLDLVQYAALWIYSGDVDRKILLNNSMTDSELNQLYLLERPGSLFKCVEAFRGTKQEEALDFLRGELYCPDTPFLVEKLAREATEIFHRHPHNWWEPTIIPKANVFLQRGLFEDSTPFHVAVLFNKVAMAKALYSLCNWYLDVTYQGEAYDGEHALHIAVVNCLKSDFWSVEPGDDYEKMGARLPGNHDMLTFLVDCKKTDEERKAMLNSAKVTGTFFRRDNEYNQVNWGQTPLSFATCLFMPRVMEYLIAKGANIFDTDDEGNNVLHLLAMQIPGCMERCTEQEVAGEVNRLLSMCKFVLELACGGKHGKTEYTCLEEQMNKAGMKPFHVAAYHGNTELFKFFMRRMPRERTYWTYGDVSMKVYDLTDIDSVRTQAEEDGDMQGDDDNVCYRIPGAAQRQDNGNSREANRRASFAAAAAAAKAGCESQTQPADDPVTTATSSQQVEESGQARVQEAVSSTSARHPVTENGTGTDPIEMPASSSEPPARQTSPQPVLRAPQSVDETDCFLLDTSADGAQFGYDGKCQRFVKQPEGVKPANLLQVILNSKNPASFDLLFETPVQQLLSLKWMQYGYLGFSILFFLNVVYVVLLTLVVFYRPVKVSDCRNASVGASTITITGQSTDPCPYVKRSFLKGEAYRSTEDYVRLAGEMIVCVMTVLQLALEVYELYRLRQSLLRDWVASGDLTFSLIRWVNSILIFVAIILRVTDSSFETNVLSVIVILAWMFMLLFGRGFRFMGPYLIMIRHMLVNDILRFFLLYMVTLVAFGLSFYILFQESIPQQPLSFSSFWYSVVTLFRTTLGLTDIELITFEQSTATILAIVYMLFFLVFTYLLLVNLLIAMMERTQDSIAKQRLYIWRLQLVRSILLIERRLNYMFKRRLHVGRSGANLNLDEHRRYLCLEFKESKLQPFSFSSNNISLSRQHTVLSNIGGLGRSTSVQYGPSPKPTMRRVVFESMVQRRIPHSVSQQFAAVHSPQRGSNADVGNTALPHAQSADALTSLTQPFFTVGKPNGDSPVPQTARQEGESKTKHTPVSQADDETDGECVDGDTLPAAWVRAGTGIQSSPSVQSRRRALQHLSEVDDDTIVPAAVDSKLVSPMSQVSSV